MGGTSGPSSESLKYKFRKSQVQVRKEVEEALFIWLIAHHGL